MTKRIDRPVLPRLDREQIAADESTAVAAILARYPDRLERLGVASKLADEAQAAADKDRPTRDKLALSLSAHDGVRAVNHVLGVTRTRYAEMRKAVAEPKHYPTAARRLPALADAVARHEARAQAAREARDAIVMELLEEGVPRPQIAERIGRNPSRVSHIKRRETAGAA